MLQSIRERTQGWIAGIIISIIILTFALWGIHSYFTGGRTNTNIAEVNGVEITKEQLAISYERLRRQIQNQYGTNSPISTKDESNLKNRAMQNLIDVEVLKQASGAQGYLVSDRQIDNTIQGMTEFQVNGQFSIDRFQEILSATLLSTSEFLELIRTSLLIDQPKLGIVFTSISLPDETQSTIALVNQTRDIDYITISSQYFLNQPLVISPEKIKHYYQQNKSDFLTPEQVNVEYVALSLKDLLNKFNPTEVMLKSFYNENINSYTQSRKWKLARIEIPVSPTTNQEELKELTKKANAIAEAIKNNGDLAGIASKNSAKLINQEWMFLNQIPADLQKVVSTLNKLGDVSQPVINSHAIVLMKVVDIQEPKMLSFESVKDKVRDTYVRQHAEEKFVELRDQLADLTYEHPESLQLASKTMNLPIQSSELFTKDKPGKDISQYKKVRDIAFSNDVMNLQNNSDVIQVNPETLVVLRIKSHVASSLLPLSEVSKQIEDKLKTQEADTRAADFAKNLQAKLQSGMNPQEIATSNKLTWNTTGFLGRYSTKIDNAILDLAFRLPDPAMNQKKTSYGFTRIPNGYAIVALKSVKQGMLADNKQAVVYAEQIQNSEGLLEYELYRRSQINHAKISVSNSAS